MPQKQPPARIAFLYSVTPVPPPIVKQLLVFAVTLCLEVVEVDEPQRSRVDAVAQPTFGARTVVEDVAQVAVTVRRAHLGADHQMGEVALLDHVVARSIGLVKLGQPVPLSNLSTEANNGSPDTTST